MLKRVFFPPVWFVSGQLAVFRRNFNRLHRCPVTVPDLKTNCAFVSPLARRKTSRSVVGEPGKRTDRARQQLHREPLRKKKEQLRKVCRGSSPSFPAREPKGEEQAGRRTVLFTNNLVKFVLCFATSAVFSS